VSKHFEALCRIEQEQVVAPAEVSLRIAPLPEVKGSIKIRGAEICASAEMKKFVHVLFLSLVNGPHHVLFCGVGGGDSSGNICVSAAKALASEVSGRVCIVDANIPEAPQQRAETGGFAFRSLNVEQNGSIAQRIDRNLWFVSAERLRSLGSSHDGSEQICLTIRDLQKEFEYVLVDAPPLGQFTIASVLGQVTDGAVLILEANVTRRVAARSAKQTLDAANVRVLGTVLNNRTFPIPEKLYRWL